MSKVLVTEDYLEDIADAIRAKNGSATTYTPGQMAAAIEAIPTGGGEITVVPLSVSQNNTYNAPAGTAYNPVVVSVSGGGGGDNWEFMDEITDGGTGFMATITGSETLDLSIFSLSIQSFYNNYAKTPKPSTAEYLIVATSSDAGKTLAQLKATHSPTIPNFEYSGYIYDNTAMITDLGLVMLGDFSQGGAATGNVLTASIAGFSGVILQGIYNRQRTSGYNTSMLYVAPQIGTQYWTGMKDRNTTYDCFVTFTDNNTVNLGGNKQVIIYGIP